MTVAAGPPLSKILNKLSFDPQHYHLISVNCCHYPLSGRRRHCNVIKRYFPKIEMVTRALVQWPRSWSMWMSSQRHRSPETTPKDVRNINAIRKRPLEFDACDCVRHLMWFPIKFRPQMSNTEYLHVSWLQCRKVNQRHDGWRRKRENENTKLMRV